MLLTLESILYAGLAIGLMLALYIAGTLALIHENWDFTGESERKGESEDGAQLRG
jgi:hypothetical protein